MSNPRRIARAAQRRRFVRTAIRVGGPSLLIASLGAVLLLIADRLLDSPAPDAALFALPFGVASIVVALFLRGERTDEERAAAQVDRALGLKDRLSIGIALGESGDRDAFAMLAQSDADDAAERARVREALPIRAGWTWIAWPMAIALAIVVMVYVPALRTSERRAVQQADTAARQEQARAQEVIREATDEVEATLESADEERVRRRLEELDEIANQLEQGGIEPDTARARAAESLQAAADELEREAETREAMTDALRERLESLEETTPESPVSPLRDALRSNDLDAARRAAEEIERQLREAEQAEREQIAQELESLADEIAQATPQPDEAPADGQQQSAPETSPAGAPQENEQQPEEETPPAPEDSVREQMEQLREALREGARQAREAPRPQEQPADGATEQPQRTDEQQQETPAAQPPGAEGEQQPAEQSPSEQRQGEQQREQPGEQPGEQQNQQSPSEQTPQPGTPQESPGAQPGGQPNPQGTPTPTEGQPSTPTEGQPPSAAPTPTEGGDGTSAPSGESPNASGQEGMPGQVGEQQPGGQEQPGQQQPGQAPSPQDLQRLREAIERMAEEGSGGEEQRRDAEELREQAQRLLDEMSPEQQEQMREWAEQMAREMGGEEGGDGAGSGDAPPRQSNEPATPFQTEDFDPGGESTAQDGRVVAEWFSDDEEERTGERRLAPEGRQRLRDAADAAEKAVEDQAVPNRYRDAIKRYFDRMRRYSEEAPPPPPAQDAPPAEGEG